MNKVRERILKEVAGVKCPDGAKKRELISFCVCDGYFVGNSNTDEGEETDFDEVTIIVEKDWLFSLIKRTENFRTDDEARRFLQEEYTSDDSSVWYEEALLANKIVGVSF